jgi:long-chain acyl-CoA synthetase
MKNSLLLKEMSRYNSGTWADIIYRNSKLYPDREAFVYENTRLTFSDYNTRINKIINTLFNMNCRKRDIIGILSWNCLQFVEIYGVAMKGGFISAPFNPRLKDNELEYIINNSEANTLFIGPEFIDITNDLRPRLPMVKNYISLEDEVPGMMSYSKLLESSSGNEPDDTVDEDTPTCIIYTSGTTGVPRGALYNQRQFIEDSKTLSLDMSLRPGHKRIQITPLFHIAGNSHFRSTLYTGGCNVICKSFEAAKTLQLIQDERATHMDIVPTHLVAMLNLPDLQKYDISSLQMMFYGASSMPLEVLKKGMEVFGPVFTQGYGQSESGPAICNLSKEDHNVLDKSDKEQRRLTSAGQPDIGVQVRIIDDEGKDLETEEVGEIVVKSNHTMVEYFHKPEETKAAFIDGWLRTGDIGYYDEDGYIYIVDRKKDIIISGGENVYAREVEDVLYRHPAVLEAVVIGIPDPYWVEKVHAVITIKKGKEATPTDIIDFCKTQIAGYKVPKSVEFIETMPKNSAGKIVKRELRGKYWTK